MITLRNIETGKAQFVASLDGIDMDLWVATGDPVPTDLANVGYVFVDGQLEPALSPTPPLTPLQYMLLWTPTERAAIRTTSDATLADAFDLLRIATAVTLDDADIIAGIALALSLGILTESRAARIAGGMPPE